MRKPRSNGRSGSLRSSAGPAPRLPDRRHSPRLPLMRNAAPLIAVAWLLASCGDSSAPQAEKARAGAGKDEALIACATAGSGEWERTCTVERRQGADGAILVMRN